MHLTSLRPLLTCVCAHDCEHSFVWGSLDQSAERQLARFHVTTPRPHRHAAGTAGLLWRPIRDPGRRWLDRTPVARYNLPHAAGRSSSRVVRWIRIGSDHKAAAQQEELY